MMRFLAKFIGGNGVRSGGADGPAVDLLGAEANHQIIFREIKEFAAKQSAQMDALDTKAGLLGATATALIAGFLALFNDTGSLHLSTGPNSAVASIIPTQAAGPHTLVLILLATSFGTYLLVVVSLTRALKIRDWRVAPDPSILLAEYWQSTANETLADLCATVADTTRENQHMLDAKIRWVGWSLFLVVIEVLVLFFATAVGVWVDLV